MTPRRLLPILAVALPGAVLSGAVAPAPGAGNRPGPTVQPMSASASPNAVSQDLVILDNRQSIAGTIVPRASDDGFVDINTGSGRLRIRKERIASIVLGLNSQRERIDDKDLASLVGFARWCLARGLDQDALAALDKAVLLPDCDVETRGLRATLIDQAANRGPAEALPLYRAYKAAGGTDAKIIARLQQLEDALSAHNDDLKKLNLPPVDVAALPATAVASASPAAGPGATAAVPGKEGLEAKGWQSEDIQWSLPSDAKLITLPPEEGGSRVLAVTSPGKPATAPAAGARVPDKIAIKKGVNYAVDENSVLSFFARNRSDHPIKLAIAVKTGKDWTFFESTQQTLAPSVDFKELRFNLKAATFKSAATKWANNGTVADLDQLKELQVLIYNGGEDVDLLMRGMGFLKDSEM
jgi:hypothetical protein